jgi:multidrug transporter EmrE-like cation transporter
MILLSVFISTLGQIFLKLGATSEKSIFQTDIGLLKMFNITSIFGLFLYAVSALLWMVVLKKVELSYAYPMVSLGYVFVFIASYFLFGEAINMTRIAGLVVIIIGIIILSRS